MDISLDTDLFHAKNKDDLLRAVEAAKELGKDYFLIYDACRTELEKESPTLRDRMGNSYPCYKEDSKRENIIVEKRCLAFHLFFVIEIESAI